MSKLFASWVPGYAFVAQDMGGPRLGQVGGPFTDVNGLRQGFGVTFRLKANQFNWFHCPLPTPVIVEDRRATLRRVLVLYRFPQGASLLSVHVWDGQNRILQRDGLNITGDHTGALDQNNIFDVHRDGINFGVGISLGVSTIADADIFFASAGGDFDHNI